jgi:cob(I)alamin adenosyltransferase
LIDAADLVSEVTLVKHQMEQGIRGQQGIEW